MPRIRHLIISLEYSNLYGCNYLYVGEFMDEVQRLLAAIYNDDIGFVFGAVILALYIFSLS